MVFSLPMLGCVAVVVGSSLLFLTVVDEVVSSVRQSFLGNWHAQGVLLLLLQVLRHVASLGRLCRGCDSVCPLTSVFPSRIVADDSLDMHSQASWRASRDVDRVPGLCLNSQRAVPRQEILYTAICPDDFCVPFSRSYPDHWPSVLASHV